MNIKDLAKRLSEVMKDEHKKTEFPTGISKIDDKVWFKRGEMVIIAARPSNCKSTFAFNNIALNGALNGKLVYYFSLEDSSKKFITRHIANALDIDSNDIRRNNLTAEQSDKIKEYAKNMKAMGLYIYNDIGFDLDQIKEKCKKNLALHERKPDIVIVDYINKINLNGGSRYEAVTRYSKDFSNWIKQNDLLGVLVCQVGREAQGEGNTQTIHPPQLHHLRDSGALEQDAQAVIILHYNYKYTDAYADRYNILVKIAKNKDGDTGAVKCNITPEFNRISNAI